MSPLRVGVAMSGGIDSGVTAALLQKQGYEVHAFFMELPLAGQEKLSERPRKLCARLSIPLCTIDLQDQFHDLVIEYFLTTYQAGQTPNPCVVCNAHIKFAELQKYILASGMDFFATGHYAELRHDANKTSHLYRGIDPVKDQSYFLCRLGKDQLRRTLLPLGGHKKSDVYNMAKQFGLGPFPEGESQDVCFLGNTSLADFFAGQGKPPQPGPIISSSGKILGKHQGIWNYTIGQRRGLQLPDATPWYVIGLDPVANSVIVGKANELFRACLVLSDVQWLQEKDDGWIGQIQLRSRQKPVACTIRKMTATSVKVELIEPQRAVTPGQFGVLYDGRELIGSGIIENEDNLYGVPVS